MKVIIRERDSVKAKDILKFARENKCMILTMDKRGFQVKADSLGFSDIEIVDFDDLHNDNYDFTKPVVIHNVDKVLKFLMDYYYGLDVQGFSATLGD